MEWQLDFREDGILEIKASGSFGNNGLIKMIEQILIDSRWKLGMDTIADFRHVTTKGIRLWDLYISRDIHAQFDNMAGKGKVAVILDSNPGFFLSRIYTRLASIYVKAQLRSFKDYDEGVRWICGEEK